MHKPIFIYTRYAHEIGKKKSNREVLSASHKTTNNSKWILFSESYFIYVSQYIYMKYSHETVDYAIRE